MKYFVLGALASGMLLYGMSMIYGATGTLEITRARAAHRRARHATTRCSCSALVFVVAGIGFKLGAVPFHMWVPGRLPRRADRGDAVHRLRAQARRVRASSCGCSAQALGAMSSSRLAADADRAGGAVAGDRQHHRDRADQPEAHARLLDDLAHGLPAARRPGGRRQRLQRGDVLRRRLRADDLARSA